MRAHGSARETPFQRLPAMGVTFSFSQPPESYRENPRGKGRLVFQVQKRNLNGRDGIFFLRCYEREKKKRERIDELYKLNKRDGVGTSDHLFADDHKRAS